MRAARIENNVVVDIWEVPSLDCYGSLYTLVAAPEWVQLGATYNNGTFTNPPPPPPSPLPIIEQYKNDAKKAIDRAAGRARAKYITAVPGQEATYLLKATEAETYISNGRPEDTTPYPLMTAEAQVRGISVSEMADLIITTKNAWVQLAAQVEVLRIDGKLQIDNATTHEEVDTIRQITITQLSAI